jgi:hypothetical protein
MAYLVTVFLDVYLFTSITQQKLFKRTNYILINAWRHVLAVLTAKTRRHALIKI